MQPSFGFRLERRARVSSLFSILSPLLALFITLIIGAIMFAVLGHNPAEALYVYFVEPLTETWSLHELAIKATPLILIATGLSLCFRSGNWNIGAEGQFMVGAIVGSAWPILLPSFDSFWVLPVMLLSGMVGGMAWAAIPAFLKNRFGANEILTSLMLVYVATYLLDWLVRGAWRNPGIARIFRLADLAGNVCKRSGTLRGAYSGYGRDLCLVHDIQNHERL